MLLWISSEHSDNSIQTTEKKNNPWCPSRLLLVYLLLHTQHSTFISPSSIHPLYFMYMWLDAICLTLGPLETRGIIYKTVQKIHVKRLRMNNTQSAYAQKYSDLWYTVYAHIPHWFPLIKSNLQIWQRWVSCLSHPLKTHSCINIQGNSLFSWS